MIHQYFSHLGVWRIWRRMENLPIGWEKRYDEQSGRYYYVDHINSKTQWENPTLGYSAYYHNNAIVLSFAPPQARGKTQDAKEIYATI